jgi:SAM-dependent methyltransferase
VRLSTVSGEEWRTYRRGSDEQASSPDRGRATTDHKIQNFWLQNLQKANGFTRWVIDEISPWLGRHVLEVGCGVGTYTVELAAGPRVVVAVDIYEQFAEEARRRVAPLANVHVFIGDAARIDIAMPNPEGFDSVILLDVLEHIEHDMEFLARMRSRLRIGGHLILKVPAMPSLFSPMDEAIGHWRRYDKATLNEVMTRAGFEVIALWPFNAFAVPAWWLNGRVLKRDSPPAEQIAFFEHLVPVLRRLDRIARLMCGISLIAVGQRSDHEADRAIVRALQRVPMASNHSPAKAGDPVLLDAPVKPTHDDGETVRTFDGNPL